MSLHVLHTTSGIMILICLLAKMGTHAYIDFRHGRLGGIMAEVLFFSKYVKPYRANVSPEYQYVKYACNLLLRLVVVFFLVNLTVGILILF
jgi:hypothetical protein